MRIPIALRAAHDLLKNDLRAFRRAEDHNDAHSMIAAARRAAEQLKFAIEKNRITCSSPLCALPTAARPLMGDEEAWPQALDTAHHMRSWPNMTNAGAHMIRHLADGRDALQLALRSMNLQRGDEVLVPAFLCRSIVTWVAAVGGVCKFFDIDDQLLPNINDLARRMTARTKAVLFINYFGRRTQAWAAAHAAKSINPNVSVIVSAAQAVLSGAIAMMDPKIDFAVLSLRKFSPLPEGGVLFARFSVPFLEEGAIGDHPRGSVFYKLVARMLRGYAYASGATVHPALEPYALHLLDGAEDLLDAENAGIYPHAPFTSWAIDHVPLSHNRRAREVNAAYLTASIRPEFLAYPHGARDPTPRNVLLRVAPEDRMRVIAALNAAGIVYPPSISTWTPSSDLVNPAEYPGAMRASQELVRLPIDAIYGTADLDRILRVLAAHGITQTPS